MTPAPDPSLDEFYRHQAILLPHTARHIGRRNLGVGCGSGITSAIHAERLGTLPTLCDVIDIRHERARAFPFRLLADAVLPFGERAFGSSYLQYVLHHIPDRAGVRGLLAEAARVGEAIVIVEEIAGARTDIGRAKAFDREVNAKLHPEIAMPVYDYCTANEVRHLLAAAGRPDIVHALVMEGSAENGFLETHVFVGRPAST